MLWDKVSLQGRIKECQLLISKEMLDEAKKKYYELKEAFDQAGFEGKEKADDKSEKGEQITGASHDPSLLVIRPD